MNTKKRNGEFENREELLRFTEVYILSWVTIFSGKL
jgi:hypothetical protein